MPECSTALLWPNGIQSHCPAFSRRCVRDGDQRPGGGRALHPTRLHEQDDQGGAAAHPRGQRVARAHPQLLQGVHPADLIRGQRRLQRAEPAHHQPRPRADRYVPAVRATRFRHPALGSGQMRLKCWIFHFRFRSRRTKSDWRKATDQIL